MKKYQKSIKGKKSQSKAQKQYKSTDKGKKAREKASENRKQKINSDPELKKLKKLHDHEYYCQNKSKWKKFTKKLTIMSFHKDD